MTDSNPRIPPGRLPSERRSKAGFTLFEVLVAMSVIAISLSAVYRLHSQTLSMAHRARFYTIAPLLAHQKMAEFQLLPPDDLADDTGDFGEGYASFSWKATVNGVESELLRQTQEDFKRIDITIHS